MLQMKFVFCFRRWEPSLESRPRRS